MRRVLPWILGLLSCAGFLSFLLCFQVPKTTTFEIRLEPRNAPGTSPVDIEVFLRPVEGLSIVPGGSALSSSIQWEPLIKSRSLKKNASLVDGVIRQTWRDPTWSPGVQKFRREWIEFRHGGAIFELSIIADERPCSRTLRALPSRVSCYEPGGKRISYGEVFACNGAENVISLDTGLFPFIVAEGDWKKNDLLLPGGCGRTIELEREAAAGKHMTLPFSVEDEIAYGRAYPSASDLAYRSVVREPRHVVEIDPNLDYGGRRVSRRSWELLLGTKPDACSNAWSLAVDGRRRQIELKNTSPLDRECLLVVSAEPPTGPSVHVIRIHSR